MMSRPDGKGYMPPTPLPRPSAFAISEADITMLGRNIYDNEDVFIQLISKFTYLDTQCQLATSENALTMAALGRRVQRLTSPLNVFSADVFDHILQFARTPSTPCIKEVLDGRGESNAIIPFCGWKGQESPIGGINLADLSLFRDNSTIRISFSTPEQHLTDSFYRKFVEHVRINGVCKWTVERVVASLQEKIDHGVGRRGKAYFIFLTMCSKDESSADQMPQLPESPVVEPPPSPQLRGEPTQTQPDESEPDFGGQEEDFSMDEDAVHEDVVDVSSTTAEASSIVDVDDLSGMIEVVSIADGSPTQSGGVAKRRSRKRKMKEYPPNQRQPQQPMTFPFHPPVVQSPYAYSHLPGHYASGGFYPNPFAQTMNYPSHHHLMYQPMMQSPASSQMAYTAAPQTNPMIHRQPAKALESLESLEDKHYTDINNGNINDNKIWMDSYRKAYRYRKDNGDCKITSENSLYRWANRQRSYFNSSSGLVQWKVSLLIAIDFDFKHH